MDYCMKENKIRKILDEGGVTNSTRLWSTWPLFTELAGTTENFDYIELVGEYTPLTLLDMENVVRAAELHNMGSMLKVDFQNRGYVAQKAVGAGFQAILFADHHTPDEVRESISMIKPDCCGKGRFGYPNRRFIGMQTHIPQKDHVKRLDDIVLAFMIEKGEAMDNIEEICSIPGVDMVQFGPNDYSMSYGRNRDEYVEEAREAERLMIKTALKHGVQPRAEIQSPEEAQYYIDLGVRHFSLADQFKILKKFWDEEGGKLNNMLKAI